MRHSLPALLAMVLAFHGCGSPETSVSENPPSSASPQQSDLFLVMDLSTRVTTKTGTEPAYAGLGSRIVFRRTLISGTNFYIQTTPVTQQQYRAIRSDRPWTLVPSDFRPSTDTSETPVYGVSLDTAAAYASAVGLRMSRTVTIISSVNWLAIAGPTVAQIPDPITYNSNAVIYTSDIAAGTGARPVSQSPADSLGLRDVFGNVRQWLDDGTMGGPSWCDLLLTYRSATRNDATPSTVAHPLTGIRLQAAYPQP